MIYIYKMHAGMLGTDQMFWSNCKINTWEYAVDHALGFGNEQDEYDEWSEGNEPECWLVDKVSTVTQLEEYLGELLIGGDTLEDLLTEMAQQGVVLHD